MRRQQAERRPARAPLAARLDKLVDWKAAVEKINAPGLHFHDLRHTGNTLAARTGASLADLMARMGHDSSQAAMIYQHKSREADRAIAQALNATMKKIKKKSGGPKANRSRKGRGKPDDGTAGVLAGVS